MKQNISIKLFLLVYIFLGCNEQKYPVESLPQQKAVSSNISDTLYVKQNPDWLGFNGPEAVIIGNEPLVYVADTYNNRIVMLDIAGRVIGYSQRIQKPVAIAQDKRLHLLVCAEFDTLLSGHTTPTTFGAVYRLNLPAVNHNIANAVPQRVIWDTTLGNYASRRYTAIATTYYNIGSALYADAYYVARTGQKNSGTFDPDNAICLYSKNDIFQTSVTQGFTQQGTGLLSMHKVTGLATPPTGTSTEFVFSQIEDSIGAVIPLWKVQWIKLIVQGQTENWDSKYWPSIDGDIDILKINRFVQPRGVALDPSGNLFIVDAVTDSLYRFSSRGTERYSFGGQSDPYGRNLNQPYGIAYYDKTLFVADKGNNRICRFKLSIDMNK
jgi:hypothetical protein